MTLDDLRVFAAVCRTANLSDVARELGCSQPAVSQHVRRLERELGLALVERRPRGVTLTDAGRALYSGVAESLGALDATIRRMEELREGERGSVRIATGGTAVKHFMSRAVARFRKRFPDVSLEFLSANSTRRCLEALRDEECDLAWITMGTETPGIEQLPAVAMPWMLVGPSRDPLLSRRRIGPEHLRRLRYIPLREEAISQAQLRSALHTSGARLDATASVDDWDTAILLVELGFGYTIVPAMHGRALPKTGSVRAVYIDSLPNVTFGWTYRKWKWLPPAPKSFVDVLAQEMGKIKGVRGLHVYSPPGESA
jgi:DNA-binding transcriptional LysR family regulator